MTRLSSTWRCSQPEPAGWLRNKSNVCGGWLRSLIFALDQVCAAPFIGLACLIHWYDVVSVERRPRVERYPSGGKPCLVIGESRLGNSEHRLPHNHPPQISHSYGSRHQGNPPGDPIR
jgi:hypothetical protein